MKTTELISRVDYLINKGNLTLASKTQSDFAHFVKDGLYAGFRSSSLSFISSLFGQNHTYFKEFNTKVNHNYVHNIESGINILESIKYEIENGWLTSLKELVTAELFSDFLEMSKHLLDEKYKDASAVMIGSVLEEHIRQLCIKNSIDTLIIKGDKTINKRADSMNSDLAKESVYGILEQKSVTAWLDLRNKAAHGKYGEYTIEQVNLMYQGVFDFITRTK